MIRKLLNVLIALMFFIVLNESVFGQLVLQTFSEASDSNSNYFGYSVAGAGDVNGDGFDDIIIGAYLYNNERGRAYIYYGGLVVNDVPDIIFTGENEDDRLGISVSGAGDVNGDGFDDVIVGAEGYDGTVGGAYVYYGGVSMDTTADVMLVGEDTGGYFGYSVSNAGDVNGDGYADVIVGALFSNSTGRAYVYYGGSSMDDSVDVVLNDGINTSLYGYSVSDAGDVNGDSYDDVIVGAHYYDEKDGRAFIYYGSAEMDGAADLTLTGTNESCFGRSVSGAGDVNGDSFADVIVGAYYAGVGYNGYASIYYGGSEMDDTADVILNSLPSNLEFGYSVSGGGDVNGDSFDDVIISSSYAESYDNYSGGAYIYYGGSSMDDTVDVAFYSDVKG